MDFFIDDYDVAVIGAGHAGCEAALASARLGCKTIIFSINLDAIANMPCNPSIGGTSKGHLVREIDALGGEMGKNTDKTFIQSKMLNTSKGPAVFSLRAQADRRRYQMEMKYTLEQQENLDINQAEISDITISENKVVSVRTARGGVYRVKAVVLATGTYLKGRIILGDVSYDGGPDGMFPATYLSRSLKEAGIELMRFKTGTPARINAKSIHFEEIEEQPGDKEITPFSFENEALEKEQIPCWLTYTNEKTHEIIKANLHRSPLYSGNIKGTGPRYCPSIEDKIVRFADKERHQIFIEPMGENTDEMYVQGMSSSLPEDVQYEVYHSIKGLEDAKIMRPAYAIEYDCINPTQLKLSLEHKTIEGMFFAGQINGSSGYEEAAAQGIIAGINAARKVLGKEPFILDRSEAYIGVLIDDLVTKGTNEPYRMMTSRAEYRLILRQDNADMRLTEKGYQLGLISRERYEKFLKKKANIEKEIERVKNTVLSPTEELNAILREKGATPVETGIHISDLLRRSEIKYDDLEPVDGNRPVLTRAEKEQVEVCMKYEGYIERQMHQIEQFKKLEKKLLPKDIDYNEISGLALEARQKLNKQKPESIGQASRISGVSPADISVLLVWLSMKKGK
ncbi:MAG: tRNA uridine-5-carboxymethylaminomethyl(34) synthesis enzyme MnmG [Clostridia bacterium]|nr:tRNA uridine-5-carboxymethylaminomethyl(34) synthesis enzyme MnmG [Clostridia bacterium]